MADGPDPLKALLAQLGISSESAQRYRFGGIVGKVCLVALGGFAAAFAAIRYATGLMQAFTLTAILVALLIVIRWMLAYAEKHPVSATLEGAEVILWQQVTVASKGNLSPPQGKVIPDPLGPPPQLNPPQGEDVSE